MPNGISPSYQLDQSISFLGLLVGNFSFLFKFLKKLLFVNSRKPDQTQRSTLSDLVMHCLQMSQEKDAQSDQSLC